MSTYSDAQLAVLVANGYQPYQEIGTVLFADAGANTTTIMINLQAQATA